MNAEVAPLAEAALQAADEIERLRHALDIERASLWRARALLEAWDDLDFEECEGPDGAAVMIDQHQFDAARNGLDDFLRPPREPDSDDIDVV